MLYHVNHYSTKSVLENVSSTKRVLENVSSTKRVVENVSSIERVLENVSIFELESAQRMDSNLEIRSFESKHLKMTDVIRKIQIVTNLFH